MNNTNATGTNIKKLKHNYVYKIKYKMDSTGWEVITYCQNINELDNKYIMKDIILLDAGDILQTWFLDFDIFHEYQIKELGHINEYIAHVL